MSFYITSDTHGLVDIEKINYFFKNKNFTNNDYLIICGDVGICNFSLLMSKTLRDVYNSLPIKTLFIDGNHENFNLLNSYEVKEWNGGKVHFISDKIIHLMRGQVFNINNTTFFTFGGAYSIDKFIRTENVSWFKEELPNNEEFEEGLINLQKNNNQVDYVLTHTAPKSIISKMGFDSCNSDEMALIKYLEMLKTDINYKHWYFGHFHNDIEIDEKFTCIYNKIFKI